MQSWVSSDRCAARFQGEKTKKHRGGEGREEGEREEKASRSMEKNRGDGFARGWVELAWQREHKRLKQEENVM